ncbi:MAG: hypothetical protein CMB31_06060 [Euryarchaeota archaeon]|nr:hypothetical protein [Euryarchaeota archaeon]
MSTRTKRSSIRSFAAVIAAALIASVLALVATPASAATQVTITARASYSGTDRYNTAEKVHTGTNAKDAVTDLVIASGDNYPDALCALGLAEKEDAGILLLPQAGTMTAAAVTKASTATQVYIVGGTSAVSSAVETKLKTTTAGGGAGLASSAITRYAGSDRYTTCAMVANAITGANVATFNSKKTAIVVSGEGFADAVSASMLVSGPNGQATTNTHPILLTQKDSLPTATEVALQNLGVKQVVIIGGTGAVSSAVETTLKASYSVTRISGADRFATTAAVADLAVKGIAAGGFGMNKREVYLAEMGPASGGADALAAGQIVNADGSVLLGTNGGSLASASSAWLTANPAGTAGLTVTIIGGTGVIPAATEAAVKTAAGGTATGWTASIDGRAGQTTVTVTFSEPVLKSTCATTDLVVIAAATGVSTQSNACTMTTVPSTAKSGSTAVFGFAAAITKGDELRLAKGVLGTADGRTNALTTATVAGDTTKPTVSTTAKINATGTVMTFTFSEPVKIVNALTNADLKISGVANASNLTTNTRLGTATVSTDGEAIGALVAGDVFDKLILTRAAAFAVGTTVQFVAGAVQDLNGNTNTAGSAVVTSDTTVPTLVGSPTVVQAAGAAATYVLDGKVLLTAKTAGSAGNLYQVIWAVPAATTATTRACTAAAGVMTLVFDTSNAATNAGGTNTTTTATQIAATINASATCSALVTAAVQGGAGALTAALSATAQAANANAAKFGGGTHTMTVTSTFSESMLKSSIAAASIVYDGTGDNNGAVNNTATSTSVNGAVVTTVHSVTDSTKLFVPGTSKIDYANTATDLVGNAMAAAADQAALVG